jgi:8-oxo-dGTP diphosphatase
MNTSNNNQNKYCDVAGAEAFIPWNNKALIAKRSDQEDFLAGYWEVVGGRVEQNENMEQACIRETKEESGLEIKIIRPYHEYSYTAPDGRSVCGTVFLCQLQQEPKVTLSEEHQEYTWISADELKDISPMTKEMRVRIKKGFQELAKE